MIKHKVFSIPVNFSDQAEQEMDAFCAHARIVNIEKNFVADGGI